MTDDAPADDAEDGAPENPNDEEQLVQLLDFLHRSRGFDFTGYKRGSLMRRIRRRMVALSIDSFEAYVDHLEVHPDEFPQLFNLLLINVTSFFRDTHAWQALTQRIYDVIDPRASTPIRVWSAGCSSGEEPYTLAMVLAETLGVGAFVQRVKIYATDVDEDALAHARLAAFTRKAVDPVPPALVEKYFSLVGSQYVFNKDLRRAVVFGRHDLVQDAPIPRVDVLACRNTLMYFNAETQTRVLERLRFALNPRGLLFLGKAEMLLTQTDLFTPLDLKQRLFTRSSRPNGRVRMPPLPEAGPQRDVNDEARPRVLQCIFDSARAAEVVVDNVGHVVLMNPRAAQLFNLSIASALGHAFRDLELSYRPVELRSVLEKVRLERRPVEVHGVERTAPTGEKTYLDVSVVPLFSAAGMHSWTSITFADSTHTHQLQLDLRRTNAELEAAHQELQATSEELETTNEELQSTVEELETTNEELQSTNEELETMNEELQSTNEELQTINEELRQRAREVNDLNTFHTTVLASLRAGVAVVDADANVLTWNTRMEDMWGARSDEVIGRRFLELDIGLPLGDLRGPVRACLASNEESDHTVECTNRRGRTMPCKVSIVPLRGRGLKGLVVVVEEVKA